MRLNTRSADTPSTSAWCDLKYTAKRPSLRPSIRCVSHNGRCRSSNDECSREHSASNSRTRAGCGNAFLRTWCSRSNCSSTSQPHWPSDVIDRRARFWNSGATSVLASAWSNSALTSCAVAPSGGWNSCRLPTCIGCSRVSASRNSALCGGIGTSMVPSLARFAQIPTRRAAYARRRARPRSRPPDAGRGIGVIGLQRHVPDAVPLAEHRTQLRRDLVAVARRPHEHVRRQRDRARPDLPHVQVVHLGHAVDLRELLTQRHADRRRTAPPRGTPARQRGRAATPSTPSAPRRPTTRSGRPASSPSSARRCRPAASLRRPRCR